MAMANICVTHVFAGGPGGEIDGLRLLHPFDFASVVPIPRDLAAAWTAEEDQTNAELSECEGWRPGMKVMANARHDWYVENWGTKGIYEIPEMFLDEPTRLGIRFETPWSPPSGVLKALSDQFPALELTVVSHDIDMPMGFAWRCVAGMELDLEAWGFPEVGDYHDDCDEWVGSRVTALKAATT
jgi:hypothetical protein